ncbi:MAG: hypothetical protein M1819_001424 [Sarea resinae]|nr:MAG: hypothetical protein M1819_001424 [Sarea resinae]
MDEKNEKSKGISLRKKRQNRPKISAPQQISGPTPSSQGASLQLKGEATKRDTPSERPQLGGKTADLVKRRYSTRFTQPPDLSSARGVPVPSVPSIPGQYAPGKPVGHGPPSSGSHAVPVDLNVLQDPNLQPEKYVASILSDASEQDIRDYQMSLRKAKNRTSADLQQNVFQNRTQFIKISKEAERLKGEMRTLRTLMTELTSALSQATATTSGSRTPTYELAARKQANRSSVANLEALWNTQLQTLWKTVEGSQKYLPAVPGRHIVRESDHWVELDAATWKVKRDVRLCLLNDHFLVASKKKRRGDGPTPQGPGQKPVPVKLVAERCWPLQDIEMLELSSASSMTAANPRREKESLANAILVRVGRESFTYKYRKEDETEMIGLLLAFRKAAEDLRRLLRAETEDKSKARDSFNYFTSRDPGLLKKAELLESLSDNMNKDRPNVMIDVDGKQQNLRWLENEMDELDISIALQRFEEAVAKVETLKKLVKGLKGNAMAQELIAFKADERAGKLAAMIIRELVDAHSYPNATQRHVGWLTRLGYEDQAREAYLDARSSLIRKRIRQCIFEGDLHLYIYQISFISFTVIRNTFNIYMQCFPPQLMSSCVKWAKEHVDDFNKILARQLSSVDPENPVWAECMDRARTHASMLNDVGLDFKELIGRGIEDEATEDGDQRPVGLGLE